MDTAKLTRLIGSWVWALKLACLWASFLWQKGKRSLSILALSELAHGCLCWGNLGFILIQLYQLAGSFGKQYWHTGVNSSSSWCGVDAFEPTESKASAHRGVAASVTWEKKRPQSSVQGFPNVSGGAHDLGGKSWTAFSALWTWLWRPWKNNPIVCLCGRLGGNFNSR